MLTSRTASPAACPEQPYFVVSAGSPYYQREIRQSGISHFYRFRVTATPGPALAIPDGCVDILFDCDSSDPRARVCGTLMHARAVELRCGHHYFGVRFLPGMMPDFLDLQAEQLPGHEFNFLDAVPDGRTAFEQIVSADTFSRQIALFNHHFASRSLRAPCEVIRYAIERIRQQHGNIRIDALETRTGYSSRTLQRLFRADTGMSPKGFCRVVRFQSAIHALSHSPAPHLSRIALDLGFSDQSHFLREFRALNNTTPGEYWHYMAAMAYASRIQHG